MNILLTFGSEQLNPSSVLAVVKGAVLFGVSRDAFASRKLCYTYGIRSSTRFDVSNPIHKGLGDDGYLTYMINGSPVVYVAKIFNEFAKVGFVSFIVRCFCDQPCSRIENLYS